jgi:hypothetical protein
MDSVSTLHDFVLNLLSDPTALTAFAADPQSVLSSAGLGDITPGDVTNALPLVADYAPSHLVPALEAAQSALPIDGLSDGPGAAIAHLTALTSTVTGTSSWVHIDNDGGMSPTISGGLSNPDLGLSADGSVGGSVQNGLAGALGVTSGVAHANWAGGVGGIAAGLTNFAAGSDLTGALDSDAINKVTGGELNAGALSGATAFATNLVADPTDVLAHPTDITNALTGSIGGSALPTDLLSSLPTSLPGLPTSLPGLPADPTAAVTDTLHNALGSLPTPGDLGGNLGLGGLTNITSGLTNGAGLDTHDPLSTVTSHLPGGVTDLVSSATSQIPGAADALHTATSAVHGVVGDATSATSSASPLDGVSASAVGDTVSHVTGDVTGALHGVVPDLGGDHGLLGL